MKLLFTGDFFYDHADQSDDIKAIAACFKEKQFCPVINYEGVYAPDTSYKPIKKRGVRLAQDPKSIEILSELGTVAVMLSNNHTMDYGENGLKDTIAALKNAGIQTAGAGKDLEEACRPAIIKEKNSDTAIFNFGWKEEETVYAGERHGGCAPRDNELILKIIRRFAAENPDTAIIPVMHWGFEYSMYPMPFDIELADKLCEIEQVKMVIGHHTHCPQPYEIRHGKPVFYSLGNFYFAGRRDGYNKVFPSEIKNRCDYGLMVGYDTEDHTFSTMTIMYDRTEKKSIILGESPFPEKMPEKDYRSEEYFKLVKEGSMKGSPVLGTDKINNWIVLAGYNFWRSRVGRTLKLFCHLTAKSV